MNEKAEANKTLVRTFVDVVKNQRKLDRLGEFFAADYKEHNETVASFGGGVVGYQKFLGHLFERYPDDKITIDLLTADGDLVSYRATETGTNKGTFLNIPPTGKRATWTEIQFFRIALHDKDMGIVTAAAREAGVVIPLGAVAAQPRQRRCDRRRW